MDANIFRVLTKLVDILKVPVTKKTIANEVKTHPYFPSILTISDALDKWKLPNGAYKLTKEELCDVPKPFIVQLNSNNGEFALVTEFCQKYVVVSNERWSDHRLKYEEFGNIFSGTIILAEATPESGEADFKSKLFSQRLNSLRILPIVLCAALLVLIQFSISPITSLNAIALLLLKSLGLIISVLLLIQHIDAENPLVQQLCIKRGKVDCNAILSSKAAKVAGVISWAELGFIYFAGSWLTFVFYQNSINSLIFLAIINLITLPYTFYSLYYQSRIAGKWCLFCCIIIGIFWLEFFSFYPFRYPNFNLINSFVLLQYGSCFLVPAAIWIFVKPFFIKAQALDPVNIQLNQLKYDPEYFWHLIDRQQELPPLPVDNIIMLGNMEAEHTITMVASLNCSPCAETHRILEKWLEESNHFKLQIIFATTNDVKDPRTKVAAHLMSLYRSESQLTLKALNDWYDKKYSGYHLWAVNYPTVISARDEDNIHRQREWSIMAEIEYTPTLLINGRKVHKAFKTEELKYFIKNY